MKGEGLNGRLEKREWKKIGRWAFQGIKKLTQERKARPKS